MTITELSDETLCAYLDGEMPEAQRAAFEKLLESEPGARIRLERFRQADERVRAAFALPARSDDDPIARLIKTPDAPAPVAISRPAARRRLTAIGLPLAAAVAGLVIGANWRTGMVAPSSEGDPTLISQPSLAAALDTLPSGRERDGVRVVLSFRQKDQTPCRQFEIRAGRDVSEGVACRAEDRWKLVALDASAASNDGYRTAGGSTLLDGVIDGIDATGALPATEETKLIGAGWRASPR